MSELKAPRLAAAVKEQTGAQVFSLDSFAKAGKSKMVEAMFRYGTLKSIQAAEPITPIGTLYVQTD